METKEDELVKASKTGQEIQLHTKDIRERDEMHYIDAASDNAVYLS